MRSRVIAVLALGLLAMLFAWATPGFAWADERAAPGSSQASLLSRLAVQEAELLAGDGAARDFFGCSVAVSGDTAVVGAYGDGRDASGNEGAAFVFVRSGGSWRQQAMLTADDGAAGDEFGYSVAIAGDTVVVGARFNVISPNGGLGSAYVFVRSGETWTQEAKLIPADWGREIYFGASVAIYGDSVVVGAPQMGVASALGPGAAYVFQRSGTSWSQQAKLTAFDRADRDFFGYSVAISGDAVAVGAKGDDIGDCSDQGSAYVFHRTDAVWSQQAKLVSAGGSGSDFFGSSIAIAGDTVLVGAPWADVETGWSVEGAAYVFQRSGTTWSQEARLTAADARSGSSFGCSVALLGDDAVVGACSDTIAGNDHQGSAYLFKRSSTEWSEQAKLTADGGAADDMFGGSVALSGDTVVVGAAGRDIGSNLSQGSGFCFKLIPAVRIIVAPGGHGSITPGSGLVAFGSTPTYAITPDAGYHVSAARVDAEPVALTSAGTYTFPPLTANHTISAEFVANGRPRVAAPTCPRSVKRGQRFRLRGALKPHFTAGARTVSVKAYRYVGRKWKLLGTYAAVNRDSGAHTTYTVRVKLMKKGKYRFRAFTAATQNWRAGKSSPSAVLRVK